MKRTLLICNSSTLPAFVSGANLNITPDTGSNQTMVKVPERR